MKVIKTNKTPDGVPDFYNIYLRWLDKAEKTGDPKDFQQVNHFARLAEEFGFATIEDEITLDCFLRKPRV